MPELKTAKFATVSLNPQRQTIENVHKLVGQILGRAGCENCGRIAFMKIDFLGDPPPEFGKDVISFNPVGF